MKILIYGMHFNPDLIGIGKYTGEMTDWLFNRGYDIRVITAPSYYPEWKLKPSTYWFKKEKFPYLIWRCPIYVPSQPKGFTRLLHLLSFAISSIPILIRNLFWKPDFVISIEPPFITTPLTIVFSKLTKSKSILHVQDLEIDAAHSLNILEFGYFYKIIKKIEKLILNSFDTISTISPMMMGEIIKKGINKDKITILPNWADIEKIDPTINNDYLKERLSIDSDKKIISYSGNIGEKQNLLSLINIAEKMQSEYDDCLFILVGDGSSKKRLQKEVNKRDIKNVLFLPLLPLDGFGALLTMTDIHLILQDSKISDYVLPSKLTNILCAGGVSIITAKTNTQLSQLVEKYKFGFVVEPDSETDLFKAIIYLLNTESQCKIISNNARQYAINHLSKNNIRENFEKNVLVR